MAKFNVKYKIVYEGEGVALGNDCDSLEESLELVILKELPELNLFGRVLRPEVRCSATFIEPDFHKLRCLKANSDGSWSIMEKGKELYNFHIGDNADVLDKEYPVVWVMSITGVAIKDNGGYLIDGDGNELDVCNIISIKPHSEEAQEVKETAK